MLDSSLLIASAAQRTTQRRRRLGHSSHPRSLFERTIAAAFAVPVADLHARTRRAASVAFARQCAMYLAHVTFGLSYTEVGRMFGRDRTTAAHACRLVEERRDDPFLDSLLSVLESACRALRHRLAANGERR